MSERPNENGEELPPRLLAAYADGEVTPEERARIEAWLTDHPEAAAEVDAQRSLARLYEETPPPAPSEEEWRDVLAGIELEVNKPRPKPALPPRRWPRYLLNAGYGLALAAACVLLTVALWSPLPTTPTTQPQKTGPVVVVDDPLVIASGEDIRIESMNDADRAALIVGDPPVRAPLLELLGPDEVKVTKVEPTDDGHMGSLWPTGGAGTPMIVMPLSASEKGP
jgi:anti-sigma-K factor RskA